MRTERVKFCSHAKHSLLSPDILGKIPAQVDHGNRGLVVLQLVPLIPDCIRIRFGCRKTKSVRWAPFDGKAVLLVGEWANVPLYVVAPPCSLRKETDDLQYSFDKVCS